MKKILMASAAAVALNFAYMPAFAGMAEAEKWINDEFQPSTLSKDEQMKEMEWFINAAKPFAGMEINVLSEGIPTHSHESEVLTRAFENIAGIKVDHQIFGEGEVVAWIDPDKTNRTALEDALTKKQVPFSAENPKS